MAYPPPAPVQPETIPANTTPLTLIHDDLHGGNILIGKQAALERIPPPQQPPFARRAVEVDFRCSLTDLISPASGAVDSNDGEHSITPVLKVGLSSPC